MKQNRRPAPCHVVPDDPDGTTWALPEGAIARLGKGIALSSGGPKLALPPDGMYFAVQTRIGLWWYEMSSKLPIALWETERGMISAADFSQDGEWIAIANYQTFPSLKPPCFSWGIQTRFSELDKSVF